MAAISTAIFDLFDGILPVVFVLGDSVISFIGQASTITKLVVTSCKSCFVLLVMLHLLFLYFVKKQKTRTANITIDLIKGVFIMLLLLIILGITIARLVYEIKNKDEKEK